MLVDGAECCLSLELEVNGFASAWIAAVWEMTQF